MAEDPRPLREQVKELQDKEKQGEARDEENKAGDVELATRVKRLEEALSDGEGEEPPPPPPPLTAEEVAAKMNEILQAAGGFANIPVNSEYWSLQATYASLTQK